MPRTVVNGIRLHYLTVGRGPDVVMIHGLAANLAFWYLSIARRLTAQFRITLYDLRGHGMSDAPASGYTSADMAADLGALLDHLGVDQVHLVGHSFGGAIALHYAALAPGRVRSLVLADVRVRPLQPRQRLADGAEWRHEGTRLAELGVAVPEAEEDVGHYVLEELARARARRPAEAGDAGAKPALPFDRWLGRGAAQRWLALLETTTARADVRSTAGLTLERIRAITVPTLAVYGAASRCMPSLRQLVREMPRCVPVVVPRAGHFHPLSRPGVMVRCLRAFLADPEGVHARRARQRRGQLRCRWLASEPGGDSPLAFEPGSEPSLDAGRPA